MTRWLRRGWRVVTGRGRWRAVVAVLGLLLAALVLAWAAWPAAPAYVPMLGTALGLPALVLPWRWLGTLTLVSVTGTLAASIVVGGDASRPWLLPAAVVVLLTVVAVEPLERGGDEPVPVRLAVERARVRLGLPLLGLAVAAGVGAAAVTEARPSPGLVVLGLAAALVALGTALRVHRRTPD